MIVWVCWYRFSGDLVGLGVVWVLGFAAAWVFRRLGCFAWFVTWVGGCLRWFGFLLFGVCRAR